MGAGGGGGGREGGGKIENENPGPSPYMFTQLLNSEILAFVGGTDVGLAIGFNICLKLLLQQVVFRATTWRTWPPLPVR